jgi:hypothetical protein
MDVMRTRTDGDDQLRDGKAVHEDVLTHGYELQVVMCVQRWYQNDLQGSRLHGLSLRNRRQEG